MNTSNTLFAKDTTGATSVKLSSVLSSKDFNNFLCRISSKFRMNYKIDPGLYTIGNPTSDSPVLVTANYKLTVNVLRAELEKFDIWLLVIDTRGINVWCAAGKGRSVPKRLLNKSRAVIFYQKLNTTNYSSSAWCIRCQFMEALYESGFNVKFGPVRASDIPVYLQNNFTATQEMRRVRFGFTDRAKLVPMEAILHSNRHFWLFYVLLFYRVLQKRVSFLKGNRWCITICNCRVNFYSNRYHTYPAFTSSNTIPCILHQRIIYRNCRVITFTLLYSCFPE